MWWLTRWYVWQWCWRSLARAPRHDVVVATARLVKLLLMIASARRTLERAWHVMTRRATRACQRHATLVAVGGVARRRHGGEGGGVPGQRAGGKNERQQRLHSPPLGSNNLGGQARERERESARQQLLPLALWTVRRAGGREPHVRGRAAPPTDMRIMRHMRRQARRAAAGKRDRYPAGQCDL